MSYIEALKDGFRLIHRNWQLVLIQLGVVIVNIVGFFIIVGIPVVIAFTILGIDLARFTEIEDILKALKDPSEVLSRYFGLFLVVTVSLVLYTTVVAIFGIYVFGGSTGVIGKATVDKASRFSIYTFFNEAKRLFMPLLGFTAIMGIVVIAVFFILGIFGGGMAALMSFMKGDVSTLTLFFSTFLLLILLVASLGLIVGVLSIALYGIAVVVLTGKGPLRAFKNAINYLLRHPNALGLFSTLLGGYVLVSFFLILPGYLFSLIPVIGVIFSFPYQLISYAFEVYLGLVIIATVFIYYHSTEIGSSTRVSVDVLNNRSALS